jgi:hypothetical protein
VGANPLPFAFHLDSSLLFFSHRKFYTISFTHLS